MDKIAVSGCIVTFNNVSFVDKCICSLLRYTTGVDFQLMISDNCSIDNTIETVRRKYPEVEIIQNDHNGGFGYGHNQVIPKLESKYHAVINPDIEINEDVISQMVEYLEEHPDVGMVTPKILNMDGTEQFLPKRDPSIRYVILSKFKPFNFYRTRYTRADENLCQPTSIDSCTGCFFIIRTDLFKQLNGFDNNFFMYYEDADLSRRARKYMKIIFYPLCSVYHNWQRENIRNIRGIRNFLHSMLKYFKKWEWRF